MIGFTLTMRFAILRKVWEWASLHFVVARFCDWKIRLHRAAIPRGAPDKRWTEGSSRVDEQRALGGLLCEFELIALRPVYRRSKSLNIILIPQHLAKIPKSPTDQICGSARPLQQQSPNGNRHHCIRVFYAKTAAQRIRMHT